MPLATLRLTAAEKRRFTAEARGFPSIFAEVGRVGWKTFFAALPA